MSEGTDGDLRLIYLSMLAYGIAAAALVGIILQHAAIAPGMVGRGVQIAGLVLMVWARGTFRRRSFHVAADATEGGLVTTGPYRFVRHPIYTSILVMLAPAVLTHLTLLNAGLAAVVLLGLGVRMATEERLVTARYPAYREYAQRTKRIIPFVV